MLHAFGATDKGCVRTNNEDSFLVAPELGLYLVADGMGGAAAGETASRIAAETMRDVVEDFRDEGMNGARLVSAFHEVSRRIKAAAQADSKLEGMGTTMVAVLEPEQNPEHQLLVASVGDSRVYRFLDGTLTQVTEDQSWVNDVGKPLGLSPDLLRTHPMRHVLTMALGVSDQLKVNAYTVDMQPGALVLLCSDGLHGPVTEPEIAEILGRAGSVESRSKLLIDTARAHGGPDNVTVVLLETSAP